MNKQKFIELLRKPNNLTPDDLRDLDELIEQYPYFQCARSLTAKVSKLQEAPDQKKKIASAAIYVTNRAVLKRYITGDVIFLNPLTVTKSGSSAESKTVTVPSTQEQAVAPPSPPERKAPPSVEDDDLLMPAKSEHSNLEKLIEEIQQDMKDLRESRAKYLEVTTRLEEEEAVDQAVQKATGKKERKKKEKPAEETDQNTSAPPAQEKIEAPKDTTEEKIEDPAPEESLAPQPTEGLQSTDLQIAETEHEIEEVKAEESTEKTEEEEIGQEPETEPKIPEKAEVVVKEKEKKARKEDPSLAYKEEKPEKDISKKSEDSHPADQETAAASPKAPENTKDKDLSNVWDVEESFDLEEENMTPPEPRAKPTQAKPSEKMVEPQPVKSIEKKKESEATSKKTKTPTKKGSEESVVPEKGTGAERSDEEEPDLERKQDHQNKIIDEFIKKNPSFSPHSDVDTSEDMAKASTAFHEDIATEYLAEIYLRQGKKQRAIQIYEKLELRFPEKSVYFADIIKKLKEE